MSVVGFYGDGFLEMPGLEFRKISSSIGFSFRTLQSNTMLLLSTFQGPDERLFGIPDQETEIIVIISHIQIS